MLLLPPYGVRETAVAGSYAEPDAAMSTVD